MYKATIILLVVTLHLRVLTGAAGLGLVASMVRDRPAHEPAGRREMGPVVAAGRDSHGTRVLGTHPFLPGQYNLPGPAHSLLQQESGRRAMAQAMLHWG